MQVGPGEAPNGHRKQNGKTRRIFKILNQKKLVKQHLTFYKPFLESSLPQLIGLLFKHANQRKMNRANFKARLEALHLWRSGPI